MALQKLSSTDAFVVTDLPGAAHADGVVRWAKKVLQDGARTMARSRSYSWALLEQQVSGASAGISAAPDDRDAAIAAFVEELQEPVAAGTLSLDAGKGVAPGDLTALQELDRRSPLRTELGDELLGIGIAAAADVALGGLAGATAVVEGAGASADAIAAALVAAGAEVAATGDGAEVATTPSDLLVCGSKMGLVDHDLAAELPQRAIVPCGVAPVTAKGLAVARRRDVVVVADFLSLLGPLLAFRPADGATAESLRAEADATVRGIAAEVAGHEEGPYLGAAYRAEAYLSTWQESLPFGRPLA
ncbi:hypothetical protein [Dermatobacter hominis]|uniref:hypothetical protein n=1 Tax=Dermatobacter hominis TaxID=2884263 RepID=UPI001D121902|nr:hypothetical protein [Dermatobacter hominis]UDY36346.1 hypothetical protein LH044_02145 [Dermatobacter hominis]